VRPLVVVSCRPLRVKRSRCSLDHVGSVPTAPLRGSAAAPETATTTAKAKARASSPASAAELFRPRRPT